MKTKYVGPTQEQIVDFYYFLLSSLCEVGYIYQDNEKEKMFFHNPEQFSKIVDGDLYMFPRETSPEVYEYYVSDIGIKNIRNGYWSLASSKPSDIRINKIKITICEDE